MAAFEVVTAAPTSEPADCSAPIAAPAKAPATPPTDAPVIAAAAISPTAPAPCATAFPPAQATEVSFSSFVLDRVNALAATACV